MEVTLGQIVISKAGRDSGKRFIVVGVENESFLLVSDGALRKIEKPKRKKIKHLNITGIKNEQLAEKLINKEKVANSDIRKALSALETI